MKTKLLPMAILLASTLAVANDEDCNYVKSSVHQMNVKIEGRSDFTYVKSVLPSGGKRCSVRYQAKIEGQWHPVYGVSEGLDNDSFEYVCARAVTESNTKLLSRFNSQVAVTTDYVCSSSNQPKTIASVKVGQFVKESEVAPHPYRKFYREYKGLQCRWFSETEVFSGKVTQYEGIICQRGQDGWMVVDKWAGITEDKR